MEFWKELRKKENTGRILVKTMNKIYETGDDSTGWKTSMLHIYKRKEDKDNPANYRGRISLLSTIPQIYTGVSQETE
jgi:hypothetical protein